MLGTGIHNTVQTTKVCDKRACTATEKRSVLSNAGRKNTRAARSHLDVSGRADSDASVGRGVQLARSSQAHDATFVRKKKKEDDDDDARIEARFNQRGQYANALSPGDRNH